MLTVKYISQNKAKVIELLKIKNFDAKEIIDKLLNADDKRRQIQKELDENLSQSKIISKSIGKLFKEGKKEEAEKAKKETTALKENNKLLNRQMKDAELELSELLLQIPNVPHPTVPKGNSEQDNQEIRKNGQIPELTNDALAHWDLIKKYDIIDFELGTKITGAGFPVYKGKGAKLQRALINFFLDEAQKAGYTEYLPPILVNEDSAYGTGSLPDKEGQMYQLQTENMYLIPTAEVPVTNIYRDVILNAEDFPFKNTAYTPCFRREAGAWGSAVRGLNRLHQFDKVEIVQIQHPEKSYETLEEMVKHAEMLIQKLDLPYRIVKLCGGDLSFTSALTYDFEVYAAAQKKWLEVSSVSNFESFQAHRLKLRFKEKGDKKTQFAHTLNGSALALPRIVAAILENNQTPEGIKIPKVLVDYTGFDTIS